MSEIMRWPAWLPRTSKGNGRANGHGDEANGTNGATAAAKAVHPANGHAHAKRERRSGPLRVLAIGAHPDDIELGCGGTLVEHHARGHSVSMLVMSQGESGPQHSISRRCEQEDASRILGAQLFWGGFDDAAIPESRIVVDTIQDVMTTVRPDVIYSHTANDSHQDHRAIALATLAAARRSSRILQYEAPSSLQFVPAMYVDIREALEGKLSALRAHVSQVLKNGLVDLEAVEAQARYRGFQARIRLAEAFEVERFVWDLDDGADPPRYESVAQEQRFLEEVR